MFVEYDKRTARKNSGQWFKKLVYPNLEGCVFKLARMVMETGSTANAIEKVRFFHEPQKIIKYVRECN